MKFDSVANPILKDVVLWSFQPSPSSFQLSLEAEKQSENMTALTNEGGDNLPAMVPIILYYKIDIIYQRFYQSCQFVSARLPIEFLPRILMRKLVLLPASISVMFTKVTFKRPIYPAAPRIFPHCGHSYWGDLGGSCKASTQKINFRCCTVSYRGTARPRVEEVVTRC